VVVGIDVGGDHLPCLSSVSNSCRQPRIAEIVAVRGRGRIGELAQLLSVTDPTIRKDLTAL
jgi:DeoR/GlpR family transcriptional regulator of sugar metabolism